jgi:hypothetical protein
MVHIDTHFDYWTDVNPGRSVWDAKGSIDPDSRSKHLRRSHQMLWSKLLPTGERLNLTPGSGNELRWGAFRLSSDSISNSYMTNGRMRLIVLEAAPHAEELFRWGSRIGAYILYPANRVNLKPTINGARGMCIKIGDRMDLTLEAIRRHYIGEGSPLTDALDRYRDFFALFGSFEGYVNFWLLNDLVDDAYRPIFFLPFDNFTRNAPPADVGEYLQLKTATVRFLQARTDRIGWWSCNLSEHRRRSSLHLL